jgi:hypothetical protein
LIKIYKLHWNQVDKSREQIFAVPEKSVEAFGQAESLTSRLRTILDMYPDGNPIFRSIPSDLHM